MVNINLNPTDEVGVVKFLRDGPEALREEEREDDIGEWVSRSAALESGSGLSAPPGRGPGASVYLRYHTDQVPVEPQGSEQARLLESGGDLEHRFRP